MRVKVSKVFAKFIESNCPKLSAEVVELSANSYEYNVGSIWDAGDDYNPATGKFKAICVSYPPEWYASPRYISTAQILEEFHRYNVTTAAGLVDMLNNWLQI
jgi:hypothetical protein